MPSKIWSISVELKRSVPLNSRCSRKCETPASATVSSREPVRIQKPRATERTVSIRSETTRSPDSSSVSWCASGTSGCRGGSRRCRHERAEGGRLDDLALELVADLDFLGHRADAIHERVCLRAGRRVDQDGAVLLHVYLGVELVGQRADRLATLADDHADLVLIDLDRA